MNVSRTMPPLPLPGQVPVIGAKNIELPPIDADLAPLVPGGMAPMAVAIQTLRTLNKLMEKLDSANQG